MSKNNQQADHALLESWRPPRGAGDPVGCLATTFTFDAGFFEEECLARFLEIDSLPDREGLAYLLERENRLGPTYVGVLADHRQAGVDHSLRWDVLPVRIPRAKQHAKLSLLVWTNHIRIVVSSGNLTQHGYRYNREVAGTIELTPMVATHALLTESREFLEVLVDCVPGAGDDPVCRRAREFLGQVQRQAETWSPAGRRGTHLFQHLAFTLPRLGENRPARGSLAECIGACRRYGPAPSDVSAASPFYDPPSLGDVDKTAAELCKAMARGVKRSVTFCVPRMGNDDGAIRLAAPKSLLHTVKHRIDRLGIEVLPQADQEGNPRPWHAKMLALATSKYTALMIGSSNFTKAGMGLDGVHNAEANLVYVARREAYAREAGALSSCWPTTTRVDHPEAADIEWQGPQQELDEEEHASMAPAVPSGFISARYRAGQSATLLFTLAPEGLPSEWQILGGIKHDKTILDASAYAARGAPERVEAAWKLDYAPGTLLVIWAGGQAFWPVNVEDQSKLPAPREIESMSAQDMLHILAASDASAAFRAWTRQRRIHLEFDEELDSAVPPDLDPLRRYSLQDTFLRRVRRQARLLAAAKRNLERPVWSEQALQWRLTGMIGVQRLAERIAKGLEDGNGDASEVVLNLADLLLMLGDVEYHETGTALSRRKFYHHYKRFLQQLSDTINAKVQAVPGLPRDVQQFWSRVHKRLQP